MPIPLATTTSAPFSSTFISAQQLAVSQRISSPSCFWALALVLLKAEKGKQRAGNSRFFCSFHTISQLRLYRSSKHSVTLFFSPNILLWQISKIQKSWKNGTGIPPIRTHHLYSTVKILLCLFPSLHLHLRDPLGFWCAAQSAVGIKLLLYACKLFYVPFFFTLYRLRIVATNYQVLPLPGTDVEHLPSISWFDFDSNPMRWGSMPTLILQLNKTKAQRTRTTTNSYLLLPMGHAWCQKLSMNYLLQSLQQPYKASVMMDEETDTWRVSLIVTGTWSELRKSDSPPSHLPSSLLLCLFIIVF